MKSYRLKVRRRTTEMMLLTVRAESSVHAHEIGEADVRANKHPGQSKQVEVTVLECHEERSEQMGLCPSNKVAVGIYGSDSFPNLAGHDDPDSILRAELTAAGITHYTLPFRDEGEVTSGVRGSLDPSGWGFHRAWCYWVADGPGIPPEDAQRLHEKFGKEVRVSGDCTCPGPEYCNGFAVGMYHVDTPRGLKALADLIKEILARSKETG